jgi:hypothetical protein
MWVLYLPIPLLASVWALTYSFHRSLLNLLGYTYFFGTGGGGGGGGGGEGFAD